MPSTKTSVHFFSDIWTQRRSGFSPQAFIICIKDIWSLSVWLKTYRLETVSRGQQYLILFIYATPFRFDRIYKMLFMFNFDFNTCPSSPNKNNTQTVSHTLACLCGPDATRNRVVLKMSIRNRLNLNMNCGAQVDLGSDRWNVTHTQRGTNTRAHTEQPDSHHPLTNIKNMQINIYCWLDAKHRNTHSDSRCRTWLNRWFFSLQFLFQLNNLALWFISIDFGYFFRLLFLLSFFSSR